jgi:methylthioribose-1-phosphate isomerase
MLRRRRSATRIAEVLADPAEADSIYAEDRAMCRALGEHGLSLLPNDPLTVLTHCNAGALATAGMGTALAPLYLAHAAGRNVRVFAGETRPLLQGSRITAWELRRAGIEVTVLADNAAASLLSRRRIDAVLVGADRIAANGDVANKIGTYALAVLARRHGVPLYVLAPTSTIDPATPDGAGIPIEERGAAEINRGFGRLTAPADVPVYAPAFDVTPAELVSAIVTDRGVHRAPYDFSRGEGGMGSDNP